MSSPAASQAPLASSNTPAQLQLVVRGGVPDGAAFKLPLGVTLRLGRLPTCDLVIPDDSVSRIHCSLQSLGSEIRVTDLDSTNGTFINDVGVDTGLLRAGDQLTVGATVLECRAVTTGEHNVVR